jgi:hypothetical protein
MKIKALALVIIAALCSGCVSDEPYDSLAYGVNGGLAGGVIGAGTGALIGSQIPNGVIAASAITGAVVGVPVGAALFIGYAQYEKGAELREARAQVDSNDETIAQRNQQIQELRQQLSNESFEARTDGGTSEHLYPGPTLH